MVRNLVIIVLAALLGVSSYLLYSNKNITVNIGNNEPEERDTIIQEAEIGKQYAGELHDGDIAGTVQTANRPGEEKEDKLETLEDGFDPEIHLDPTVGMTISSERQIVSSYKIIGPRKFSLLTDQEETMVEIDLDTGRVTINPKYDLDEVTIQFWKSVSGKYPEVCFVE